MAEQGGAHYIAFPLEGDADQILVPIDPKARNGVHIEVAGLPKTTDMISCILLRPARRPEELSPSPIATANCGWQRATGSLHSLCLRGRSGSRAATGAAPVWCCRAVSV